MSQFSLGVQIGEEGKGGVIKGPNQRGSTVKNLLLTYITVSNVLKWINQFSGQGPKEDDDHHKWVDVLPQNGQECDPTGAHRPS